MAWLKSNEQKITQINTAAIAQHLNITESAIIRIEEWANVLFVVCRRLGARFVTKKILEIEDKNVIDERIPKTLEEARALGQIRFHSWNEEARGIVQEILVAGREVCITSHLDPIAIKANKLADLQNETRLPNAIAKIAVALGAKVRNY